MIQRHLLIAVK